MRMKQSDGSFIMHEGGESDLRCGSSDNVCIRCVYINCVGLMIVFRHVRGTFARWQSHQSMDIMGPKSLCTTAANIVAACQTFEGGLSAVPGTEAHGGYRTAVWR